MHGEVGERTPSSGHAARGRGAWATSYLLTFDRSSIDNRCMIPDSPRPRFALIVITQALLGMLILLGLGTIALLPSVAASAAVSLPEYADLRAPLLAMCIAVVSLALLVLAVASLLVHRIRSGTILLHSSTRWVDAIVAAVACAIVLVIATFVIISNGQAGSPFLALTFTAGCLTLLVLACITLVLRSLLRHAILLRIELDEVV